MATDSSSTRRAYLGAPSIVTFLGVASDIPGLHAIAGRTVVVGEVIDITPAGVPIVDPSGPLISEVGNHEDPAVVRAASAPLSPTSHQRSGRPEGDAPINELHRAYARLSCAWTPS